MSFVNLEFWSDRWRDKFNNDLYIRRLSCLISFIMHFVFCLKKIKYCRESKASLLKVFKEIRIEPIRIERVEAVVRTVRLVRVSRWSDLVTKIVWKMLMPYQVFLCSSASPFLINHYFVYQRSSLSVPPRCSSINSSALKKKCSTRFSDYWTVGHSGYANFVTLFEEKIWLQQILTRVRLETF